MKKNLHPCPVCKKRTLTEVGAYEICSNCNWEDDPSMRKNPNFAGGANKLSLNEAVREYEKNLN